METYHLIIAGLEAKLANTKNVSEDVCEQTEYAIDHCRDALNRMRELVIQNGFPDKQSEIYFFKNLKPQVYSKLLYHQALFDLEINKKETDNERLGEYFKKELEKISDFMNENKVEVQYHRCGFKYMDEIYFLRGGPEIPIQLKDNHALMDEKFFTWHDHTFSTIMAYDMLLAYLMQEIERLNNNGLNSHPSGFPSVRLTWRGTKTELMEQLYCWDSASTFGDVPLTQLSYYIQNVFNIRLDKNLSRAFSDMKIRNVPTPFLDKLKDAMFRRMGRRK